MTCLEEVGILHQHASELLCCGDLEASSHQIALVEDMIYVDLFQRNTVIWKFVIRIMTVQNNNFATNETVPENSMLIVVEVKKFNPNKT